MNLRVKWFTWQNMLPSGSWWGGTYLPAKSLVSSHGTLPYLGRVWAASLSPIVPFSGCSCLFFYLTFIMIYMTEPYIFNCFQIKDKETGPGKSLSRNSSFLYLYRKNLPCTLVLAHFTLCNSLFAGCRSKTATLPVKLWVDMHITSVIKSKGNNQGHHHHHLHLKWINNPSYPSTRTQTRSLLLLLSLKMNETWSNS